MTAPLRLLELGGIDGLLTQASYHVLAEQMAEDRPDTVVLCWPTSPYLCLGYHQVAEDVLRSELSVPVVRRRVGGGLTYLDEDQVFYQFVMHHRRVPASPRALYRELLAVPVAALRRLGVAAELTHTNEIEVGGRRIAGTGAARIGEASVLIGNVLLDFDVAAMVRAWPPLSPGFVELAEGALRERIATLRGLGVTASREALVEALAAELEGVLERRVERGTFTAEEQAALAPMVGWLTDRERVFEAPRAGHRRRPLKISARAYLHRRRAVVGGVEVEADLLVVEERIAEARLRSEPGRDWSAAERGLVGKGVEGWEVEISRSVDG